MEEENNLGQRLLDELEKRLDLERKRTDVARLSLAEQQDYLKSIQEDTRTKVLGLDRQNQILNAQLRAQQQVLSGLQEQRASLLRQQSLLANQGDLFGQFNMDMSEIDAKILSAEQDILVSQQDILGNSDEIRFLTQNRFSVEQDILAAKQQELSDIQAAKQTQFTLALRRGRAMGAAFAGATMLERVGMFADAVGTLGKVAMQVLTTVYDIQRQIGVEIGTAVRQYRGALIESAKSFFSLDGPLVSSKEILEASAEFTKEFGTILDPKEAARIAKEAKNFGVTGAELVKAKRAFLGAGAEDATRNKVIAEFKNAGLTAAQALKFAANNANLVAIAGVKYADALARAAANATKIGVAISSTERFADNIVGDFEGALMGFTEAAAMGIKLDANEIFRVAATGGPEAVQKTLASQLGGNQALIRELQTNRFLKLSLQEALPGLDISEIIRLSGGSEQKPAELTVAEQSRDYLAKIVELLGKGGGAVGTASKVAAGALQGGAAGAIAGAPVAGIGAGVGAGIGGIIGGAAAFFGDDVISSPGYGSRALVTETGVIGLNNKDTVLAGTQLLSAGSLTETRQGTQSTTTNTPVNINISALENKLDQLVSVFGGMKIEMDGNTVGRVSLNARSPIDRLSIR